MSNAHPEVEVTGNTVKLRLSTNAPMRSADTNALPEWVN